MQLFQIPVSSVFRVIFSTDLDSILDLRFYKGYTIDMSQKWNLQDIRPASPRRKKTSAQSTQHAPESSDSTEEVEILPIRNGKKTKQWHTISIALVLITAIAGTLLLSYLMRGAEVTVYPRNNQPNLNATIVAYSEPRPNELSYELLEITSTAERQVAATGETEVQTTASGRIEIMNENDFSQELVATTRFASPSGNIYRIQNAVTIPPATTEDGTIVPGTVVADVIADAPGEEYNITDTVTFTIPGFEEGGFDELFQTVYAQNVGPIDGGFDGIRVNIADDDRKTARQELQMALRDELHEKIDQERPAGFLYYPNSIIYNYVELPAVEYGDDMATIKEEVTLYVPLFEETQFANYLAAATIPGYDNEPVRLENPDDLSFSYLDDPGTGDLSEFDQIEFVMSGRPLIIWKFDEFSLISSLMGEHLSSLDPILRELPEINRGEVRIQPFWQRSLPSDPELITIHEVIE